MSVKTQTEKYWKDTPFKSYFYVALVVNLVLVALPFALKNFLPPVLPLLYERPTGTGQLVSTFGLAIAPAVSLGITLINILLSFFTKDDFLKKVLAVAAFVISILTAITILKIIFLVGFF